MQRLTMGVCKAGTGRRKMKNEEWGRGEKSEEEVKKVRKRWKKWGWGEKRSNDYGRLQGDDWFLWCFDACLPWLNLLLYLFIVYYHVLCWCCLGLICIFIGPIHHLQAPARKVLGLHIQMYLNLSEAEAKWKTDLRIIKLEKYHIKSKILFWL